MAYNSYYPATYQPYQQNYYPTQYQQIPQVQQQIQPQIQNQSSIIWVNSGVEAQAYPVAPNNAVTLWSTAEPVVYLKKADASGKPSMTIYDLVERKEQTAEKNVANYATKDDLSAVSSVLSELKSDIETIKGDVYGIAGKKKKIKGDESDE